MASSASSWSSNTPSSSAGGGRADDGGAATPVSATGTTNNSAITPSPIVSATNDNSNDVMSSAAAATAPQTTTTTTTTTPQKKKSNNNEISIYWDYESVPLPSGCSAAAVSKAIVATVSTYGGGRIVDRRLYYNLERLNNQQNPSECSSLDSCGFDLVHTPTRHGKETIDKKLIADVLTFSWDATVRNNNGNNNSNNDDDGSEENANSKPYVVLLTSDGDYAYTLSKLRDRGVQTIVICSGHSNTNNNNNSNVLADVADIALSLEGDVLQLPVTSTTTPRSSSSLQQQQLQQHGLNNSTGKGDYYSSSTTTSMDASLMEFFVASFCRLIYERNQKNHEDGDWQNYAQLSELLQRIIRQKKPPSTSSDEIKEWTKQIRAKSVALGLVQIGRKVLPEHSSSSADMNGSISGRREVLPSTAKNYDKSKLSLEMFVALLPQGQAVARGQSSVGNYSSNSTTGSLVVSSPGGDVGGGSSSNNDATTTSPKAEMEVLIVELCRIVQQKVANSANNNTNPHFDSWVDLGGVLARIQTIIRQRSSSAAKNSSSSVSKKMKDYDVKEKARSVRELAATRGLIAIGKRRLDSGFGEEREIIALSKNTRHLTLSGESYVCLLPKGEMRLAEPDPPEPEAPVTERRLVVHTTTATPPSSSSLRTSGTSYLEMAAKASPANGSGAGGTPSSSPSPTLSSFDLCLALCRIIHERANGPAAMHGGGWVDLGETIQQLQQIMRGNSSYSTEDIKDKARSIRQEAGKRGLLESGRRVLNDNNRMTGYNNNDNSGDKEIVPLSKETKHQYHHLKLGEYYLRLLDKGEKLVISNQGNNQSLAVMTPSSYSSRLSPSMGQQGTTDFMVSLVKGVQKFSSDKDGWANLGSVFGLVQTAIRKSSNNRSFSRSSNPDEIKELARSLREQAVDNGLIELGRRRLDATGLGGAREIVVCNESRRTDPSLSQESYVRLLFKGEVLLQKGIISSPSSMVSPSSFSVNSEAHSSSPSAVPRSSSLVFVRNLPSTTQVRDLVRFLEVEFSVTVTRARIRNAPHSTMCAHIEVLRAAEAALMIEQSKNQTNGGEGIYFNNRRIMISPETITSSLDVVGDEAMYYEKDMAPMSSTSPGLVETGTSLTLDETTETDVMSEFAAEWAGKNTCIVLCRNFPRVTHVLDLVRFLQNTFPVTVCRALMQVAGAMSSAYVELLHASEANMLIDEAKKTPGNNAMVFQNRPISVFPSYSTAALDAKGDETMYYEAGEPTFQPDSFNDAAGADHHIMQPPGSPIASVDATDTSSDLASFCLVLLSLEDKQGLDPNSWINGANVGAPFRSLLPREYVQTASKDEMSARFKTARTKAVEGGLIEVGRRRLEQGDIVTVPLSIFGRNPTELNFTLDVFFRLLSTGRTLALETKASMLPAKKESGHEEPLCTKHIFMNNLPRETSSQQLYAFLQGNFSSVVNGITLQQNNWKGESVQCAHVELDSTTGAAEILRAAKTPPGLVFCGRFIYTVADSSPEQTTATQTDAESSLMTAQTDAESSLMISSFPPLDLGGSQSF